MDLKKIQNFVYGNWEWRETLIVALIVLLIVKISEYSERLAIWLTVAIILVIAVLGVLVWITPKSADRNSD